MEILGIFSAFGLSASAGLNAYIPLLVIALLARFTNLIQLKQPWDTLESWWIIGLLFVLSIIEFFADKVPAVNHINDAIQTFVRPVAGAIAFAASANILTEVSPVLSLASGLLVAGGIHAVKSAAVRPAITATTGGAANIPVSILEDILSTMVSVLSVIVPVLMVILVVILIAWWISSRQQRRAST
ncbi:MAG: DUF4126 domain-containing protein [Chloroflexi bacterium HGW-Chloroflexi-10]|nr:MAG: DUF4126 domain-containing protein [Chloroflexi bacterium HGW-Chloroflexi-10]